MQNEPQITGTIIIRPRYNEVDKMGYVYHANYVSYCHQARTELMRIAGVCDAFLESKNIMLPVISFEINYKQPAKYDEVIYVTANIIKLPDVKMHFQYKIRNKQNKIIGTANSSVVFVNATTRKPQRAPRWLIERFETTFNYSTMKNI